MIYSLCMVEVYIQKSLRNISNKNIHAVISVFLLLKLVKQRPVFREKEKRNSNSGNSHKPPYQWRKINKGGKGAILCCVFHLLDLSGGKMPPVNEFYQHENKVTT